MLTLNEICSAVNGTLFGKGDVKINGVSTDTRTIEKGMLYVALKGERFDGNDLIAQVAEKGAAAVISDRAQGADGYDIPLVLVGNSREAQLALAGYYRNRFDIKLCGVTGSVGKTSTKDMIYAVLSAGFRTLRTEGNYNNDIGLPKTLFGLDDSFEAAVVEMGMSDLGEISRLSAAAHPDVAVITNIGYCHIENLGTRENILRAKLEILDGAKDGAPLIINGDDEYLKAVGIADRRVIRYGFSEKCDVRAENVVHSDNGESFVLSADGGRHHASIPVRGEHNIMNALAAYCVGREFGMNAEEIIPAFMNYTASGMRQRTEEHDGITFIIDCYNASPDSMRASLSVLGGMKAEGRRIAVLGDMLELGAMSEWLHAQTAEYVMMHAEVCFLYGREMAVCADVLSKKGSEVYHSTDKNELIRMLREYIRRGDVLLFKGSRAMSMEDIAEAIK